MRFSAIIAVALASVLQPTITRADETPTKGKIVGVDLFKNGLAVVKCEVTIAKAGSYTLDDVPQPVHGTFYFEGKAKVEAAMKMRDVDVPVAETNLDNLQVDLAGKMVSIQMKGANRPPVEGTILKMKPPTPTEREAPSRFVVLQADRGRVYVDAAEISSVSVTENRDATVKRRRPRLVLTVTDVNEPETKVSMRYLTNGVSWAPSYRIDISDPKTLTLEQHAIIKNELTGLDAAEIRLISGFPSVQFARVRSLIGPKTTLAGFFSELESRGAEGYANILSNSSAMSQVVSNVRSPIGPTLGATPTGEGVDLHYQPIGKRTLDEGESLALTVANGNAEYQRIVEWLASDHRDDSGRYGRYGERGRTDEDDVWDALKFRNPLSFPMSTGPATVTAHGNFNGQRTTYWVNPGEETILRVEKALSVRTQATENEKRAKVGDLDEVWIGNSRYRKVIVDGEMAVSNNRKEAIQMVMRRRFSGELVKAEADPKTTLLTEGVYSVNKRNELVWTYSLKGGEEKTLKYSYVVFVSY